MKPKESNILLLPANASSDRVREEEKNASVKKRKKYPVMTFLKEKQKAGTQNPSTI